jgi:thiol-disulfide isomerase/thioredoxin
MNTTPAVAKEKVLSAIVSKYKGKVVFVDFWATWCGPCHAAMKQMLPLKQELRDKNIVFVYITGETSPQDLFEKHRQGIDGEHYYLTNDQWNFILESIPSDGIPTYLIYDTKGVLKHKSTGYPGNEEMRRMIEELL